jgi:hypothetical protein
MAVERYHIADRRQSFKGKSMKRRELGSAVASLAVVLLIWILTLAHTPSPGRQAHLPGTGPAPTASAPATNSPDASPGQAGSGGGQGHTYIYGGGQSAPPAMAAAAGSSLDQEDMKEADREDDTPAPSPSAPPSSSHQGSGGGLVGTVASALPTITPSSPLSLPSPSLP